MKYGSWIAIEQNKYKDKVFSGAIVVLFRQTTAR